MILKNKYKENNYFYKVIFIIFIYFQLIFIDYINKKFKNFINLKKIRNNSNISPIIHDYKLYDKFDNPLISVILNFSSLDFFLINDDLKDFINNTFEYNFIDIQILILYSFFKKNINIKNLKFYYEERRVKFYRFNDNFWTKCFFDLVKLIKGKFFIFFDNSIKIKHKDLHMIYNLTKGSIENVIDFKFNNNQTFYLIRTKILKDIIDSGKSFQNLFEIIKFIKNQSITNINYIPIAFCPDNFYAPLTYNSMLSILISKSIYTFILFYLIIPLDFQQNNFKLIESLYEQFEYFNITFIKMDNRYEKAYANRYITKNAFYRLSLGELLINLNKIIYLDADTICLKDLSNLYNLNFMGKIFLGKILSYNSKKYTFKLNSGVLLLNLFEMRKMEIEKKVLNLLNNGFKDPVYHDQAIINTFFKKYIGFFPLEFNAYPHKITDMKKLPKNYDGLYDFDSIYFSYKNPSIKHFPGPHKNKIIFYQEDWYYFARKSKYFKRRSNNISNIFN